MREAEAHFNRGEYLEALADYQEVLEQSRAGGHQPRALMMSATIHGTFLRDPETALKLSGQIRERYRGSVYEAAAIFESARVDYARARYREASRLFGLYLAKFPSGGRRDVPPSCGTPATTRPRRQTEKPANRHPARTGATRSGSSSRRMPGKSALSLLRASKFETRRATGFSPRSPPAGDTNPLRGRAPVRRRAVLPPH
jgi:tetratricopeptide (TPR) repeat protein